MIQLVERFYMEGVRKLFSTEWMQSLSDQFVKSMMLVNPEIAAERTSLKKKVADLSRDLEEIDAMTAKLGVSTVSSNSVSTGSVN